MDMRPKAKRKSNAKAKTGCLTCKARRVKCGEEKPSCHRCVKLGVDCDGYIVPGQRKKKEASLASVQSRALLPKSSSSPSHQTIFARAPFENAEQYRYFDLFCSRTGYEIFPGLNSESTRSMLLQTCHSVPSIRHAVIAIGALDKTSETAGNYKKLSIDAFNGTRPNEHHQFALQQYAKAISLMRTSASGSQVDLRTALLTCITILCFEAWNGNLDLAVRQVRTGIRLILEWKAESENPDSVPKFTPLSPDFIKEDLVQLFCRFAIQVDFLASDVPEMSRDARAIIRREPLTAKNMPLSFTSVEEAAFYNQGILRRGVKFSQEAFAQMKSGQITPKIVDEQQNIVNDFEKWFLAFDAVLSRGRDRDQRRRTTTLQLTMRSVYISVKMALTLDQLLFDQFTPSYAQIIDLCEELLNDLPDATKSRSTNYCFDSRLVLPLWRAGLYCRDRKLRRKAAQLLITWPRREGIWDSAFAAKTLQWAISLEEKYLEGDHVPGWARIAEVKWTSDLNNRTALLRCEQRRSASSTELFKKRKLISW